MRSSADCDLSVVLCVMVDDWTKIRYDSSSVSSNIIKCQLQFFSYTQLTGTNFFSFYFWRKCVIASNSFRNNFTLWWSGKKIKRVKIYFFRGRSDIFYLKKHFRFRAKWFQQRSFTIPIEKINRSLRTSIFRRQIFYGRMYIKCIVKS